ncbi:hypothetical protein KCU93_g4603, partial [Aureobasidium melanogenum]
MQPLQDATNLNGSVPYSDPSLGGIARIRRRQEIDFDLVDSTPDPTIAPNDYTDYNQQAAIDAVVADIFSDPLPQKRDSLAPRDIYNTAPGGYSSIVVSSSVALSAPLNCNGPDTFIGSKLFTSGPFDETLCAAACTAQSAYNLKHPPSSGSPKLCQFYNTYVLLKDGVSQGQYCSLYTQAWDATYATNKGQWRGSAHYTIQYSVAAVNITNSGDVSCPSDVAYLSASGAAFCSAYLSYTTSVSTVITTITAATSVVTSIETDYTTEVVYTTSYSTDVSIMTTTVTAMQKRALQTPASAGTWSPSRLSKACSAVATGSTITTSTQTAATPLSTLITTQSVTISSTVSTAVMVSSTSTTMVISSPKATVLGTNLVVNPSFEQGGRGQYSGGAPTPWTVSNNQVYRSVSGEAAYDGSATAYFTIKSGSTATDILSQTINGLSTSDQYTLTFQYSGKAVDANACSLVTSLGGVVVSAIVPSLNLTLGHYREISVADILPSATSESLTFAFACNDKHTDGLLLDSVSHGVCGPPDDLKIDRRQTGHAAGNRRRSDCIGGGQYILAYPQTGSSIASSYGWELDHEACELVTVDRDGIVPVSIDDGQDGRTLLSQYQKQCPNTEGDIDELVAAIDASTLEDDTGKKRPDPARDVLNLPVPDVLGSCHFRGSDTPMDAVGASFIITSKPKGVLLSKIWDGLTQAKRAATTRSIIQYQSTWTSWYPQGYGSVFMNVESPLVNSYCRTLPLPEDLGYPEKLTMFD